MFNKLNKTIILFYILKVISHMMQFRDLFKLILNNLWPIVMNSFYWKFYFTQLDHHSN